MAYLPRVLEQQILQSCKMQPVVFLNGPRQAGKSTLVHQLARQSVKADYLTFDDTATLAAAKWDPESFIKGLSRPVIIDEVQLVPELFRVLKKQVDNLRLTQSESVNGSYILTGSANILALPQLADALVGRMAICTLYPLSGGEILAAEEQLIPWLFSEKELADLHLPVNVSDFFIVANQCTFPEARQLQAEERKLWFNNYLSTLLQRDVRALAEIEKIGHLPNMLHLMAARAGNLLNDAALARDANLNTMTYRRYRNLLEHLFLTFTVNPWYRNIGKRFVKSPKIFFTDTMLLCYLLGASDIPEMKSHMLSVYGNVLENLIAAELKKQVSCQLDCKLYHYRTHDNKEIDFILEKNNGAIVAIEVKARSYVQAADFKVMQQLQTELGNSFVKGIVLYQGEQKLAFGKNLYALPLSAIWFNGNTGK